MTEKEAAEILQRWLNMGTNGMTEERLGYIESWFDDRDAEAFKVAINLLTKV